MEEEKQVHLAIIGLGYVGLPLAVEFAKKYPVVGFDINKKRVEELQNGHDFTLEVNNGQLAGIVKKKQDCAPGLWISDQLDAIQTCNVYIVTVPTPVDKYN